MRGINNLIDTALDVIIKTSKARSTELRAFESVVNNYKDVINTVYINYPHKESILECLSETCLCLEHAMFAAISGFYSVAYDSMRKVIELTVFGVFFDKNNIKYTDWINGAPEFNFTSKLNAIFAFSEISQWISFASCNSIYNDTLCRFKDLSRFTHSSPTTWTKERRHTWKLVFSDGDFKKCNDIALDVVKLSTTIVLLYMSDLIDDAFVRIVDGSIALDITNSRL